MIVNYLLLDLIWVEHPLMFLVMMEATNMCLSQLQLVCVFKPPRYV